MCYPLVIQSICQYLVFEMMYVIFNDTHWNITILFQTYLTNHNSHTIMLSMLSLDTKTLISARRDNACAFLSLGNGLIGVSSVDNACAFLSLDGLIGVSSVKSTS